MAKVVISSLFTYDPLLHSFETSTRHKKQNQNDVTAAEELDFDVIGGVHNSLRQAVVNEMVRSVMLCVMKKEVDNLTLLIDNREDSIQEDALKIIQEKIGDSAEVEVTKTNGNDMLAVAKEVVNSIDSFDPETDDICINISSLKNTKTLGMIYGAYARSRKVKEILYVDKQERRVVTIPKLALTLTPNQRKILQYFKSVQGSKEERPLKKLYAQFKINKSSFYYVVNTLKDMGLLEKDNKLTETGEIALL